MTALLARPFVAAVSPPPRGGRRPPLQRYRRLGRHAVTAAGPVPILSGRRHGEVNSPLRQHVPGSNPALWVLAESPHRRHCGLTGDVGPNSVRPRPSAAGPYVRLGPGGQGSDTCYRHSEKTPRFGESHCHLGRVAGTRKKPDSTPIIGNCQDYRRGDGGPSLFRIFLRVLFVFRDYLLSVGSCLPGASHAATGTGLYCRQGLEEPQTGHTDSYPAVGKRNQQKFTTETQRPRREDAT